ncbi:MAG TPA: toxin-antitoxin system HicB family antitoxin [Planctomicrobium sp.]|nr:toxin-antitoxin system HicB family antitoxin [Planctomicrobium sp.]
MTSAQKALQFARKRSGSAVNWVELHNAVFGIGGKLSELFTDKVSRVQFAGTEEYQQICELIESLRKRGDKIPAITEAAEKASGTFVVRLPKSIHAACVMEAEQEGVSLNQLCVAKLSSSLQSTLSH